MERALQRRSMRLARLGPDAFRTPAGTIELSAYLWQATAAKPGWKSCDWIMSQEWFDLLLDLGHFMSPAPGIMRGLYITVRENAGFPHVGRYVRLPPPEPPDWEQRQLLKQARRAAS